MTPLLTVLLCKPAKLDQPRFLLFHLKSKVSHSTLQPVIEPLCLILVLKCNNEIVGVHHDTSKSLEIRLDSLFEPP